MSSYDSLEQEQGQAEKLLLSGCYNWSIPSNIFRPVLWDWDQLAWSRPPPPEQTWLHAYLGHPYYDKQKWKNDGKTAVKCSKTFEIVRDWYHFEPWKAHTSATFAQGAMQERSFKTKSKSLVRSTLWPSYFDHEYIKMYNCNCRLVLYTLHCIVYDWLCMCSFSESYFSSLQIHSLPSVLCLPRTFGPLDLQK